MPTCKDCKWLVGISKNNRYICGATTELEYIEEVFALDCDLGCDLYVKKLDDNETKESSA